MVFVLLLVLILAAPLVITSAVDIASAKWFLIQVMGTGLFALWYAVGVLHGKRRIRWDPISVMAVLVLCTQVVSLAAATSLWPGVAVISKQLGLLGVFLLVANAPRAYRERIVWAVALVGGATSVYGIAQHWGFDFFPWETHSEVPVDRGVSFFGHATFAGSALVICIPLTMGLAAAGRSRRGRLAAGTIILCMLYHLSFSGARIATVGLFVAGLAVVGALMLARRSEDSSQGRSRGVAGAVAALAVVVALGSALLYRAWDAKDSDLFAIKQASLAQRFYAWETAARMFAHHPILGVGVGNYAIVSPEHWNSIEAMHYARHGRRPFEVHNEYLEVALEQGLLGIAVLLGIVACGLVGTFGLATRARAPSERAIGIAYFGAMMATSIDATLTFTLQVPGSAILVWVLLGLIARELRPAPAD